MIKLISTCEALEDFLERAFAVVIITSLRKSIVWLRLKKHSDWMSSGASVRKDT